MMMSFLLAVALTFCSPFIPLSISQSAIISGQAELEALNESSLYLQAQNQDPLVQEDGETVKPYEGFNLIAFGMIAIVLLIIVFVVYKVFQRMNKTRKGEM